jgi:hypothetical protein
MRTAVRLAGIAAALCALAVAFHWFAYRESERLAGACTSGRLDYRRLERELNRESRLFRVRCRTTASGSTLCRWRAGIFDWACNAVPDDAGHAVDAGSG